MRAAIYARVSTEEQAEEGHSIGAQIRLMRQYCRRKGWKVVREYQDRGWSGRTLRRPALQEMLADAEVGRYDLIVVHKLDRLSRSLADLLKLLSDLSRISVSFASVTEDFDFASPIGKVLLALLGAFAQYFIDNLREETKKGKRERALKGLYNGSLNFGYQRTPKEKGGVPVFHQKNIQGYRLAVRMALKGHSVRKIVTTFNAAGYRTTGNWGSRPFSADTLLPILKNRFYLGQVYYKGRWLPGKHRAAIDRETWDKVQSQLISRRWKRSRRTPSNRFYPLRGLLRCAKCGRTLRGSTGKDGYRYRDPSLEYGAVCRQQKSTKAEHLEQQICQFFAQIELPPTWKRKMAVAVSDLENYAGQGPHRSQNIYRDRLARIKHLYILGEISEAEYLSEASRIRNELDRGILAKEPTLDHTAWLLMSFDARWQAASNEERNTILGALLDKAWVEDANIVAVELRPAVYRLLTGGLARRSMIKDGIRVLPPAARGRIVECAREKTRLPISLPWTIGEAKRR